MVAVVVVVVVVVAVVVVAVVVAAAAAAGVGVVCFANIVVLDSTSLVLGSFSSQVEPDRIRDGGRPGDGAADEL